MTRKTFDVVVIGGGLAGLTAAFRLWSLKQRTLLIDQGPAHTTGELGGFAKYSGAKFSMLPAGSGLIAVAGSEEHLRATTDSVLDFLGLKGRANRETQGRFQSENLSEGLVLRGYDSIVLAPAEISDLIEEVVSGLTGKVEVQREEVIGIYREGGEWSVRLGSGEGVVAENVVFAGGRSGGRLLSQAGAKPADGKGLDVGFRVEFSNKTAVSTLRTYGPDAKILRGRCRTFCLNSPGLIYHYEFDGIWIPGGVVADQECTSANVGVLYRTDQKRGTLQQVMEKLTSKPRRRYHVLASLRDPLLFELYGESITEEICDFASALGEAGLLDWSSNHTLHFPLLDWHWQTYAQGSSLRTTEKGLYVVGDCAGHARGLLQAAVSGWLVGDAVTFGG